jgi:hypothetical protein
MRGAEMGERYRFPISGIILPLPNIVKEPEIKVLKDSGCKYHPRCQICPFPKCKFEMSRLELYRSNNGMRERRRHSRAETIRPLLNGGMGGRNISRQTGIPLRSVKRILRELRER